MRIAAYNAALIAVVAERGESPQWKIPQVQLPPFPWPLYPGSAELAPKQWCHEAMLKFHQLDIRSPWGKPYAVSWFGMQKLIHMYYQQCLWYKDTGHYTDMALKMKMRGLPGDVYWTHPDDQRTSHIMYNFRRHIAPLYPDLADYVYTTAHGIPKITYLAEGTK